MKRLLLLFLATIFVSCANQKTIQEEGFDKVISADKEVVNHSESIWAKRQKANFNSTK